MPATTTLSSKGQLVLPAAIRQSRRWAPGTRLIVEEREDGVLLREEPLFPPTTIEEVAGILPPPDRTCSIEEMDAAVLAEAARRARG